MCTVRRRRRTLFVFKPISNKGQFRETRSIIVRKPYGSSDIVVKYLSSSIKSKRDTKFEGPVEEDKGRERMHEWEGTVWKDTSITGNGMGGKKGDNGQGCVSILAGAVM